MRVVREVTEACDGRSTPLVHGTLPPALVFDARLHGTHVSPLLLLHLGWGRQAVNPRQLTLHKAPTNAERADLGYNRFVNSRQLSDISENPSQH